MEGWGTGEADDDSEKICKDLKCRWCQIDILTSTQAAERKAHLAGAITVINYLSANVYTIVKCKLKPMYKLTESLINACFSILNMLGCRRVLTCQHPTRSVNIPSSSPVINQFSPVMEKWSKKWTATWCIVSKRESLDRGRNFWFTSLFTFQLSPVVIRFAEPPPPVHTVLHFQRLGELSCEVCGWHHHQPHYKQRWQFILAGNQLFKQVLMT